MTICGVYGLLPEAPHDDYWTAMLPVLQGMAAEPVLVLGDFNTGESLLDAPDANFFCSKHFGRLPACGYTDLWRHRYGRDAREHSWHGPVNPYRLDHAFGSLPIVPRVRDCYYSHAEREAGISDHSMLFVELT